MKNKGVKINYNFILVIKQIGLKTHLFLDDFFLQAQIERCVRQSIEKYREGNGGRAPSSVVIYRDGVRGASDYASAGREGEDVAAAIRSAIGRGAAGFAVRATLK